MFLVEEVYHSFVPITLSLAVDYISLLDDAQSVGDSCGVVASDVVIIRIRW